MRDGYHFDLRGTERIYITSLGPFSVIVLGLLTTVIAALMLIVLLGTVVVWIPIAILFVAAAMFSNLLGRRESPDVPVNSASEETSDVARHVRASQLVDRLSLWSGAAGLIPVPFVDMAAVGGVQLHMLRRLSEIYAIPFSENRGKSIVTSLAGAIAPAG